MTICLVCRKIENEKGYKQKLYRTMDAIYAVDQLILKTEAQAKYLLFDTTRAQQQMKCLFYVSYVLCILICQLCFMYSDLA